MKRISFLFVSVMFALVSFAQAEAGSFGVEVNFSPFGGDAVFATEGLKMRYFLSDNMAVRGTLSFSMLPTKSAEYDTNNKLTVTDKTNTTMFGLTPGFEYHLAKFAKGSVYAGAEVGFAMGNVSASRTYEDSNLGENASSKGSVFGFGAGVFTGVDYYFTSNLYIGAELGLSYSSVKTTPDKSVTTGTTTTESKDYTSAGALGFNCVPAFRLGWTF